MSLGVDELSAHIEIRQQLMRYCRGVDRRDAEVIRSVYHPDATDDHGSFKGLGVEFADYVVAALDALETPSQHHITNVLIELAGERAAVESYFLAFHPQPASDASAREPIAFVGGRYLDRFECRDGRWAIAHRQVVLDWTREDVHGEPWGRVDAFAAGAPREADPSASLFDGAPPA